MTIKWLDESKKYINILKKFKSGVLNFWRTLNIIHLSLIKCPNNKIYNYFLFVQAFSYSLCDDKTVHFRLYLNF